MRCAQSVEIGRAGSVKRAGSCGVAPSLHVPSPHRVILWRYVAFWACFCGDVATPSPAPSQTLSSTCIWLSSTLQTRSVEAILPLAQSILHVQHRVGHPFSLHHAPIGTKYRNICPRSSRQTNTHRASRQGASRGAFTADLTPGFDGGFEAHIGHDRHNGQGAKGGQIIHDKQQQIFTTSSLHIPS